MRALVVLWLLAACGDNGLMLEIEPGTSDVKSVEVFITDALKGNHMGLPMATTRTVGSVWEVVEHVTAPVQGGSSRILLMPGSLEGAPTILVLGYDANHDAIGYAQLPAVSFPHTHSDTIKVPLAPIVEVPAAGSTSGTPTGPKLVRWSKTPDDNTGNCIAVLTDNGNGRYGGDFFGRGDDMDCDQANPECDDDWYLKTPTAGTGSGSGSGSGNPFCARDDRTPDTMDVCRVGKTIACTDNIGDCGFSGMGTSLALCAPSVLCDRCNTNMDQIDMACVQGTIEDSSSFHLDCTLPAGANGSAGQMTFCATTPIGAQITISSTMTTPLACTGEVQFWPLAFDAPRGELILNSTHTATLTAQCSQSLSGMTFTLNQGSDAAAVDPSPMDTEGMMQVVSTGATPRDLLIPIIVHITTDCSTQATCTFVPGSHSAPDTMWKCLGP